MTVAYHTHQVSMKDLQAIVGTSAMKLYSEVVGSGLFVAGPVYWMYTGMDGKPDTVFTLDVAIPITGDIPNHANVSTRKLDPFHCLSTIHEGAWDKLSDTYATLMERVHVLRLPLNGFIREMYTNIDFVNPGNNITEVQVGISSR